MQKKAVELATNPNKLRILKTKLKKIKLKKYYLILNCMYVILK